MLGSQVGLHKLKILSLERTEEIATDFVLGEASMP